MSKHRLSPAPLPPSKRLHTSTQSSATTQSIPRPSFDSLLYDEVILVIFSYLSWSDLCTVQATNRNWSRLAADNQLWKALYLLEYGRTRLRGVRGFVGHLDGREMKPLPGRAQSHDIKDWKWMFRISSNWRTGRCSVEKLDAEVEYPLSPPPQDTVDEFHRQHALLLLSGNITITASTCVSHSPPISLITSTHDTHTLECRSTRSNDKIEITALALDQSPPSHSHQVRLASFLSTGEFSIFSVDHHNPARSSRTLTYVPTSNNTRTSPIIQAVYHHPLLVTLSQSFRLSLYDLSGNTVSHTQTLSSFSSHPPTSLVLSAPSQSTYKLVLAYSTPVYPIHWSLGATEVIISAISMTVNVSRTVRAFDVPQGFIDEEKLRTLREQWGRKVARVADIQTDGKWVVFAPGDNMSLPNARPVSEMSSQDDSPSSSPSSSHSPYVASSFYSPSAPQLYRLYLPSPTSSSAVPKLTFIRSLYGQLSPISALALADGRCVSLCVNGSIWVWDLEGGTGAEVTAGEGIASISRKGAVVFDERRIVSADASGVRVRRFDI